MADLFYKCIISIFKVFILSILSNMVPSSHKLTILQAIKMYRPTNEKDKISNDIIFSLTRFAVTYYGGYRVL